MIKVSNTALIPAFIAALMIAGCSQKTVELEAGQTPGLKNPSIRVQAKRNPPDIKGASFGWGVEVYKIPEEFKGTIAAASNRIKTSLSKQLISKGMRLVDKEPDYLVSFGVGTACEINEDEIDEAYLDLIGNKLNNEPSELSYKQGVMIVDVVARESKELLWRGAVMAEVDMEWPEERKHERSDAVARELLKYFPEP